MRIAWFSPFPPVRTGIAACSAEAVAALRSRHHLIDEYPESRAHDFPWIQRRRPYDLIVYQFGNSSHHDYAWPYALRYPGLVVLHDTHLHHARAALLLREKRAADYRRELAWSEPAVNPDAAELAIAGFDSRLYYEWPMVRSLVVSSRLVAVHGDATRRELVEALSDSRPAAARASLSAGSGEAAPKPLRGEGAYPILDSRSTFSDRIVSIRLGHGQLVSAEHTAAARAEIRTRYGIPQDAVLFGVFGGLTPEKRLPQILAAFRATLAYAPGARLLLAGAEAAHFSLEPFRAAGNVTVTGYIDDDELTGHIAAVDVSLNLRWPTARETSGPWLRALAAGKPTVVIDLLQLGDVPTIDPRTWQPNPSDIEYRISDIDQRAAAAAPVCIAIDIVDEDHSLRLAMRRLAQDAELRARLGRAGRDYWLREHTVEAMTDDYERVMREAQGAEREAGGGRREAGSADDAALPPHLRPDVADTLRRLLTPFGIEMPFDVARPSPDQQ